MSFTITCPICGKRDLYEFRFGGEDRGPRPNQEELTPEAWCDWVHMRDNLAGPQKEWWYHRDGCGLWFTVWRDTLTNLELSASEAKE
jgi:sarcosine oxidase subunit delta